MSTQAHIDTIKAGLLNIASHIITLYYTSSTYDLRKSFDKRYTRPDAEPDAKTILLSVLNTVMNEIISIIKNTETVSAKSIAQTTKKICDEKSNTLRFRCDTSDIQKQIAINMQSSLLIQLFSNIVNKLSTIGEYYELNRNQLDNHESLEASQKTITSINDALDTIRDTCKALALQKPNTPKTLSPSESASFAFTSTGETSLSNSSGAYSASLFSNGSGQNSLALSNSIPVEPFNMAKK